MTQKKKRCPSKKVRYGDALGAKLALLRTGKSSSPDREERRFYFCKLCTGWHLTSQKWIK